MIMNKEQIVEAIKEATGGTFIGDKRITTCMSWIPKYDCMGRPLNCNPNYIDSVISIEGRDHYVTRIGWEAFVWNKPCSYTTYWKKDRDDFVLAKVDLTPDYVKEYYRNRGGEQ